MTSHDIDLQITITDAEADDEQLETATLRLMTEMRDVGVESVNRATMAAPIGAMGSVAFAPGALNVVSAPSLVDRLLRFLNAWTARGQQRTVKIEAPDGMKIEFTPDKALSPAEMLAFIQALSPGTGRVPIPSSVQLPILPGRIPLRELLTAHFDESELRTLCFYLSIPYEDLSGQNRSDRINALIEHVERHRRIDDLLHIGRRLRPDVPWDQVGQPS